MRNRQERRANKKIKAMCDTPIKVSKKELQRMVEVRDDFIAATEIGTNAYIALIRGEIFSAKGNAKRKLKTVYAKHLTALLGAEGADVVLIKEILSDKAIKDAKLAETMANSVEDDE